jgi:protein involved in sex pheromone biosynthesis
MVAYNPRTNKVIYVSNGSDSNPLNFRQFAKDWGQTNLGGTLTGEIKNTLRYKQEEEAYNKTRQKYQNAKVVLVGHSLSGGIVSRIAKADDRAITLDPALINQKPRPNVENYRVRGDIVSTFSNDTTTLPNPSNYPNPIQAHNIENIKNQPIFI